MFLQLPPPDHHASGSQSLGEASPSMMSTLRSFRDETLMPPGTTSRQPATMSYTTSLPQLQPTRVHSLLGDVISPTRGSPAARPLLTRGSPAARPLLASASQQLRSVPKVSPGVGDLHSQATVSGSAVKTQTDGDYDLIPVFSYHGSQGDGAVGNMQAEHGSTR